MNNRVPCIRCGVLILPTTADKTGGLCKPCSGGYRDQLEAARRRYHEEAKTRENDPFVHLWESLIQKAFASPTSSDALSHAESLYLALGLLRGDVDNGGFHQYFYNSSGSYYSLAEECLILLGAFKTLEILHAAKEVLFPEMTVPAKTAKRREILCADLPLPQSELLDALDRQFWDNPDGIEEKMRRFAIDQHLLTEE